MPGRGQGLRRLRKGGQPIVQIGGDVPFPTPSSQAPLRDIAAPTAKQANLATVKLELGSMQQNQETATYKGGGQISSHAGVTATQNLGTSKGHAKQPVEQANCEATHKGVGQITSEVVTESQNLIFDKHLRSRVVSCQSPCSSAHPSSRQRTPTCNRAKKEMDTNQVTEKSLRSRRLVYETPVPPTSKVLYAVQPADRVLPSPRPITRQTRGSIQNPSKAQMESLVSPSSGHKMPCASGNTAIDSEIYIDNADDVDNGEDPHAVPHTQPPLDHNVDAPADDPREMPPLDRTIEMPVDHNQEDLIERNAQEHGPNKEKSNKRSINMNLRLAREVRARKMDDPSATENYKPPIIMLADEKKPVGPWAANFSIEVGSLIRQQAPIRVRSWKHIPAEKKDEILHVVLISTTSLEQQHT